MSTGGGDTGGRAQTLDWAAVRAMGLTADIINVRKSNFRFKQAPSVLAGNRDPVLKPEILKPAQHASARRGQLDGAVEIKKNEL